MYMNTYSLVQIVIWSILYCPRLFNFYFGSFKIPFDFIVIRRINRIAIFNAIGVWKILNMLN